MIASTRYHEERPCLVSYEFWNHLHIRYLRCTGLLSIDEYHLLVLWGELIGLYVLSLIHDTCVMIVNSAICLVQLRWYSRQWSKHDNRSSKTAHLHKSQVTRLIGNAAFGIVSIRSMRNGLLTMAVCLAGRWEGTVGNERKSKSIKIWNSSSGTGIFRIGNCFSSIVFFVC